jgi:hypothetical protein
MSLGANNWADATEVVIASSGGTYVSDQTPSSALTTEAGEPNPTVYPPQRTAWWKYTPATSGTATFDTIATVGDPSSRDTEMAVYTGTALNALTKRASDSDSGGSANGYTSKITNLAVTAGTTYYIQVSEYTGVSTRMRYVLTVTGPASGPSAVLFSGAAPVVSAVSGTLLANRVLSGTVAAASGAAGSFAAPISLSGVVAATSGSSGALDDADPPVEGDLAGVVEIVTGVDMDPDDAYEGGTYDPPAVPDLSTLIPRRVFASSLPPR